MKPRVQILSIVVSGVVVAVCFVEVFLMPGVERKPNCFETPSAVDVGRTLAPAVHTYGGIYTCGLYSRPALPDVIRCYEMKKGCAE